MSNKKIAQRFRSGSEFPAPHIPFWFRESVSNIRTDTHIYPHPAERAEAACEPAPPADSGDRIKSWLQTGRRQRVSEERWNGDGEVFSGDSFGAHDILIHIDVESLGVHTHPRFNDLCRGGGQPSGDLGVGVIDIAKDQGFSRASRDTGGQNSPVNPFLAKVALLHLIEPGLTLLAHFPPLFFIA